MGTFQNIHFQNALSLAQTSFKMQPLFHSLLKCHFHPEGIAKGICLPRPAQISPRQYPTKNHLLAQKRSANLEHFDIFKRKLHYIT